MSKTTLKKELASLSREQLIDVILTAYSANKSIKEYFDFFCNPDVDKLYDKYLYTIAKEISRNKHHYSTARISRIKKTLKEFQALNPGVEIVRALRLQTAFLLIDAYNYYTFSYPLVNGTLTILNDTIAFADKNLIVDSTIEAIMEMLNDKDNLEGTKHFRKFLAANLAI